MVIKTRAYLRAILFAIIVSFGSSLFALGNIAKAAIPGPGGGAVNIAQSTCDADRKDTVLGLEKWYRYLSYKPDSVTGGCSFQGFGMNDIGLILLAVVDDLLRVAALVAIGFIIYGGIKYSISQGSPDKIGEAQNTLQSAIIGLVIAIIASAIVAFVGRTLTVK